MAMYRQLLLAALYATPLVCGMSMGASAQTGCRVADPTGTPLNVRTMPNGQVAGTLNNGTLVSVLDHSSDSKGQPWVYVGSYPDAKPIGWVYRDFIDCTGTDMTTPSHAEEGPSFNCRLAKAPDEVLICQTPKLAELDRQLARVYSAYMNDNKGGFREHMRRIQEEWLQQRHACGYNRDCIEDLYYQQLGGFGDADINHYAFCDNHPMDIDCRDFPDSQGVPYRYHRR
jgi:hypothetical protein